MSKPIQIIYFSDPLCSYCWGTEPMLEKLKSEYGQYFDIEYKAGGMLPNWEIFFRENGATPAKVAQHWVSASKDIGIELNGDVWLEDPPASSFPPSIALKAAQLQGFRKSVDFYRRERQMLFHEKTNIAKKENLLKAALESGLDVKKFDEDFEGEAKILFEEDLELARKLHVNLFPTLFFNNLKGETIRIEGYYNYQKYVDVLLKLL